MRSRAFTTLKLFGSLLLIYALLRLAFLFLYFPGEDWGFGKTMHLFYRGLRFDFAALFYLSLPFLLYYFFVEPFLRFDWKKTLSLVIFSILHLPFLALNFTDLVYYRFNHRRSTVDLLQVMADSTGAMQSFLQQYWYVLVVFLLVAVSLVRKWRSYIAVSGPRQSKLGAYLVFSLLFLATGALIARGFSSRPIFPSTALLYFDARYQPLVNNSTFNFLYSLLRKQSTLRPKNYFNKPELDSLFSIRKQYSQDRPFDKRNVVVFVLESFSKELFPGGSQAARLPFFDSLMLHSTVFNNAYANALESNKGLPAILASFPDVMDEPVYLSNYSSIPFKGIGHILKEQGYHTSFYLGAEYDHFGFARLCRMVGIDEYRSKADYDGPDSHEDGNWGVYDGYFFPFFARDIAKRPQPFVSVLYNISSHAPYRLPEGAEALRVPGQRPWQDAATYVDDCFRRLFGQISQAPWFRNTLFVFVADHGFRYKVRPDNMVSELRIPLLVYDPRQPVHRPVDRVVKQLDIVPSLLDRLGYSGGFTSFGDSWYRPGPAFSVNRLNQVQQYIDSSHFIGYDDVAERPVFVYRHREDSLLRQNLRGRPGQEGSQQLKRLKALLQQANNSLVNNSFE